MGSQSKIEWTDASFNPVMGCTPVSEACTNCYARRMMGRYAGRKGWPASPDAVTLFPDRLDMPLHWRRPRRIFVVSMGDLFHEAVPFEFIDRVIVTMTSFAPQHTYLLLTKRPARMREILLNYEDSPAPNIWLGVTCENQARADERIPLLLQTPAAVYWVSHEPALGAITYPPEFLALGPRAWLVTGGESGPGARPSHPDWFRHDRNQCQAAGVPFFFKQWGEWLHKSQFGPHPWPLAKAMHPWESPTGQTNISYLVGKARAGHLLDGVEHRAFPGEATHA